MKRYFKKIDVAMNHFQYYYNNCDWQFPYSSYVLHCLSSMAKKDAACQECHYYFDIQYETGNWKRKNS